MHFFSEHECILLIAQVTEYMSFLEWLLFNGLSYHMSKMSYMYHTNKPLYTP